MPTLAIFQLYCGIKSIYLMLFYRLLLPGSIIEDGREEAKYDTDKGNKGIILFEQFSFYCCKLLSQTFVSESWQTKKKLDICNNRIVV
jgi:hypothetical protein